jgi:hypothetical protein
MLHVKYVREGNLFLHNGRVKTVQGFVDGKIVEGIKNRYDGIIEINEFVPYEDAEPILLTKEILEKSGFKWYDGYAAYLREPVFIAEYSDGKWFMKQQHGYIGRRPIEYVHELQNFMFALTGEELEIQL